MKLLILGGTGQIGYELQRCLSPLGIIYAPSRKELDLNNNQDVINFLKIHQPDIIINAAAYTNVDDAEKFKLDAELLNSRLPESLAKYANSQKIKLIHFSSDYVYSGKGHKAWKEDAITEPLNNYGHTKLKGDELIQHNCLNYIIFRTSWVYSSHGKNFMTNILELAKINQNLNVISDQIGSPTSARLIAEVTLIAIIKNLKSGLYHLTARETTSWHEFSSLILDLAIDLGIKLNMGSYNLHKITTKEYNSPALRPLNSRLDTSKLESALDIKLPNWKSQLSLVLNEYAQNNK